MPIMATSIFAYRCLRFQIHLHLYAPDEIFDLKEEEKPSGYKERRERGIC
jgi:hypothetical protein